MSNCNNLRKICSVKGAEITGGIYIGVKKPERPEGKNYVRPELKPLSDEIGEETLPEEISMNQKVLFSASE
jgi:hypothetical protein